MARMRQARVIPPPDDAPPGHAPLNEVERWLRARRTESGYGFDPTTGEKVWGRHTDGMEVPLTPDDRAQLRGMIFTHNHSRGWQFPEGDPRRKGTSFSPHDVQSAALAQVAELRAMSPGYTFVMRPGAHGWPDVEEIGRTFEMAYRHHEAESALAALSGKLDPVRRVADAFHNVWTELAPVLGIEYHREDASQ